MTIKTALLLCITTAVIFAQETAAVSSAEANVLKRLHKFQPSDKVRTMKFKKRKTLKRGEYLSTRVVNEGFLALGKDEWIYMVTIPSKRHKHDEEGLTLAIDQNGTIYENRAHVCGGIVHFSAKKLPENSKSFFSTFIDSDSEKKWVRYENSEAQ